MVIECISCSRKFNLNENLLKPAGSRLRCSKCGTIFPVYPAPAGSSQNWALETDKAAKDTEKGESITSFFERRQHPRVPVSIPVLCDALDFEGNPNDLQIGAIREVSQAGLAIELFSSPISEQVSLSFIDLQNRDVQIKARVVHSRIEDSLKTRVGLSLAGSPEGIEHFVTQVMKTHHSSYSSADGVGQDLRNSKGYAYPLT
jgi:predicted Zn finger-like uncharacterized protein